MNLEKDLGSCILITLRDLLMGAACHLSSALIVKTKGRIQTVLLGRFVSHEWFAGLKTTFCLFYLLFSFSFSHKSFLKSSFITQCSLTIEFRLSHSILPFPFAGNRKMTACGGREGCVLLLACHVVPLWGSGIGSVRIWSEKSVGVLTLWPSCELEAQPSSWVCGLLRARVAVSVSNHLV